MKLTGRQLDALDELLSYVIPSEERHYLEDGSPGHIYRSIYVLAKMRCFVAQSPAELRPGEGGEQRRRCRSGW